MSGAGTSFNKGADGITITPLESLDQFERCVDLQRAVWMYDLADLIPRRVFLLARRIGGQVFGAFDTARGTGPEAMIGFAMSLPGYREGYAYLHSHMLAVLPEYRNTGVGRRLKLAQRDEAIGRGITLMEWTFDPLEIKNAYLNIARLGVVCRRYAPDFYGPSSSPLQGGLPTDRLYAEWWLRSRRVERILKGLEPDDVNEETVLQVRVPRGVQEWKTDSKRSREASELQARNREALQAGFVAGLAVTGYARTAEGDGVFLLSRWQYTERFEFQDR